MHRTVSICRSITVVWNLARLEFAVAELYLTIPKLTIIAHAEQERGELLPKTQRSVRGVLQGGEDVQGALNIEAW
jgi:hypothetical protein